MQVNVTVARTGSPAAVIKKLTGRLLRNGLAAATECAKIISDTATPMAPKDTGALRLSAYITSATVVNGLIQAKAGWGREDFTFTGKDKHGAMRTRRPFTYAIHVHERIAPPAGGGRYDFINAAIELRGTELRMTIRNIMNRT